MQSLRNYQRVFQANQMTSAIFPQFSFLEGRNYEISSRAHVTDEVCGSIRINQPGNYGTRLRGNLGDDGTGHRDHTGLGIVGHTRFHSPACDWGNVPLRGVGLADGECCGTDCGRIGAATNQCGIGGPRGWRNEFALLGHQDRQTRGLGRRRFSSPGNSESLTRDWITCSIPFPKWHFAYNGEVT